MILITGGAGFIGSNFILDWLAGTDEPIVNVDALTYAGNPDNLAVLRGNPRYHFVQADINEHERLREIFARFKPRAVIHMAAESHVDRSIDAPEVFFTSNVLGTVSLLKVAHAYYKALSLEQQADFRFLHVSTDEVYGTLSPSEPAFTETSAYRPNSPYSASKASSDHAVRAWIKTYGFPAIITHCSNNFGEFQYPEKLIPRLITLALAGHPLPIYGTGENVRDWIDVHEHCRALRCLLSKGKIGQTYNIGANCEKTNLEMAQSICALLDELRPLKGASYAQQIAFVADRAGHDFRYAIDSTKIFKETGWHNQSSFMSALRRTVIWYLDHADWLEALERKKR